jgi:pimeloyl-ACP methyl ester carboxylesterase
MRESVEELRHRREEGPGFPVPLLLLYAEHDPIIPPEIGEQLAELIRDAEHRNLDHVSHFTHIDAPGRFVEDALQFFEP